MGGHRRRRRAANSATTQRPASKSFLIRFRRRRKTTSRIQRRNRSRSHRLSQQTDLVRHTTKVENRIHMGIQDNTAVYEMVGLLLPILVLFRQLRHQHIVLYVDNQAIIWDWPKRRMKKDALASVLIRVLHIMEAYIPCRIYVEHLPRKSNTIATICDNLSRKSTTTSTDLSHITHNEDDLPIPFLQWLAHPAENWQLGTEIVNYLMSN